MLTTCAVPVLGLELELGLALALGPLPVPVPGFMARCQPAPLAWSLRGLGSV